MDGKVVIGTEIDTSGFDKEIALVEDKLNDIDATLQMASQDKTLFSTREIKEMEAEAQKLGRKLTSLREKQAMISNPPTSNGLVEFLQKAGKETEKNIKKVGKWALAIFGIRSVYSTIRQAISQISSEDSQIANDIAYMKWILAQTLKPVIEWIIQALYFVVALVNNIFGSLFSINLLAGKGADEFKNMKKSTGGMSKDLKEAKKQLAGFDEMNVLQDSQSSGGGGGTGIEDWTPPDLGKFEKQIKKIKKEWEKFGKEMKETLENTTTEDWFNSFGNFGLVVRGVTEIVHGLWDIVDGFFQFVSGIADIIVGIVTGDTEKIKEGVNKMIDGLLQGIKGFLEICFGFFQTNVGAILGLVLTLWDGISSIIDKGIEWLFGNIDNVKKTFGNFIGGLYEKFVDGLSEMKKGIENLVNSAKQIIGGIVDFISGVFSGNWKKAWDGVKQIFEGIMNGILGFFQIIVGRIQAVASAIGIGIGTVIKNSVGGVINILLASTEKVLNTPIKGINALLDVVNKISPAKISKLNPLKLPRLAKGGIINMPGSGIPIGGAIAGERGSEGVIPLTDSQQMELLGEAIGKYITINASITNTMNGRVISRELQKIQNENDFAYNR